MKFVSTADNKKVGSTKAIIQNVDSDGGVFVPSSLPILDGNTLSALSSLDFGERVAKVMSLFFDDFSFEELLLAVRKGMQNFEDDCQTIKIEDNLFVHERWHGPTYSSRDIATFVYPYVLALCLEKEKKVGKWFLPTIFNDDISLVSAFKGMDGVRVFALYQDGDLKDFAKKLLFFEDANNLDCYSIGASKNDIKNKLFEVMQDKEVLNALDSCHIINYTHDNVLSLIISIACNISCYLDLVDNNEIALHDKVNFATSNFESVVAMYYATKMGLPIAKIILGTNVNNSLVDFVMNGVYSENIQAYRTMSPLLDSVNKTALWRLTFEMVDRDVKTLSKLQENLNATGQFELDNPLPTLFEAGWADEEETKDTIFTFFDLDDYVLDSNSAVGASVYNDYSCDTEDDTVTILESYESPYRFSVQVMSALSSKEKNEIRAARKLEATTAVECPIEISSYEDENAMGGEVVDIKDIRKLILQSIEALQ